MSCGSLIKLIANTYLIKSSSLCNIPDIQNTKSIEWLQTCKVKKSFGPAAGSAFSSQCYEKKSERENSELGVI